VLCFDLRVDLVFFFAFVLDFDCLGFGDFLLGCGFSFCVSVFGLGLVFYSFWCLTCYSGFWYWSLVVSLLLMNLVLVWCFVVLVYFDISGVLGFVAVWLA